jgi:hypothetical protein
MKDVQRQMSQFKLRLKPIIQFVSRSASSLEIDLKGTCANIVFQ